MFRFPLIFAALPLVVGLGLPAKAQQAAAPTADPVAAFNLQCKAIDQTFDPVGRLDSVGCVEARSRVIGFIETIRLKDSEAIDKVLPHYGIKPDLFDAMLKEAEAILERTKVAYTLAAVQVQQAQELIDQNAAFFLSIFVPPLHDVLFHSLREGVWRLFGGREEKRLLSPLARGGLGSWKHVPAE